MEQKYEWSSLVLRIVLGITFFIHGVDKLQMGLGNVAGWFESIGVFGFLAYIVVFIELIGGIALILGIGTRIASALLGFVMLGAIFTANLSSGFLAGYELDLALLTMAVVLFISGSQLYALENKIFGSSKIANKRLVS